MIKPVNRDGNMIEEKSKKKELEKKVKKKNKIHPETIGDKNMIWFLEIALYSFLLLLIDWRKKESQ